MEDAACRSAEGRETTRDGDGEGELADLILDFVFWGLGGFGGLIGRYRVFFVVFKFFWVGFLGKGSEKK